MSKRDSHTGKSKMAREAYSRYIRKLDYSPTVEEPIPFKPSNESGEEIKEPSSYKKRPVKIGQKIKDHFTDSWPNWVVSIFIFILLFLMIDSKVDLAKISSTIEGVKENVKLLMTESKRQNDKIHEQDLMARENSLRIINLEKKSEGSKR